MLHDSSGQNGIKPIAWRLSKEGDDAEIDKLRVEIHRLKEGPSAPLPKEVEEAMKRIQRALHHTDHYRNVYQNFGEEDQLTEFRRDKAALAVIRAALEPKKVSRGLIHAWSIQWQKKSAEAIEGYLTGALHSLGHEIEKDIE